MWKRRVLAGAAMLLLGCASTASTTVPAQNDAIVVSGQALPQGQSAWQPLAPESVLRSGDQFALDVTTTRPVYVYVLRRDKSGTMQGLWFDDKAAPLLPGATLHIPGEGAYFRLGAETGEEDLRIIGSAQACPADKLGELLVTGQPSGGREPPPVATDRNRNYSVRATLNAAGVAVARFVFQHN